MIPRYRSPHRLRDLLAVVRGPRPEAAGLAAPGLPGPALEWVPSASDGLVRLLAGLAANGTVVLPAYTCIRIVQAVRAAGWFPYFLDIHRATLAMAPPDLEQALRRLPRPVVVLGTHLHGIPQPMTALREIADRAGATLIEDCAMAQGAVAESGPVGSIGHSAIFSFGLGKVVSTGLGGAVVGELPLARLQSSRVANVSVAGAWIAWVSRAGGLGHARFVLQETIKSFLRPAATARGDGPYLARAWSGRAASMLRDLQMDARLEEMLVQRRARSEHWLRFVRELDSPRIGVPEVAGGRVCCPALPMLVEDRDRFAARLRRIGVHTARYFDYCAARDDGSVEEFPNAQWVASRILLLPMDAAIDDVATQVKSAVADYASGG